MTQLTPRVRVRVPRAEPPNPSGRILMDAATSVLQQLGISRFTVLRHGHETLPSWKTTDVFLYAGGILRMVERPPWRPSSLYRLWTPASRLGSLLANFGFPGDCLSHLNRYHLFPSRPPKYKLEESDSFVIAGRNILDKNEDAAIALAKALRKSRVSPRARIWVCGPNRKRHKKNGVFYLGDLGPEWFRYSEFRRSAFISLSSLHHEDFGVAVAQAQSQGMPMILSDWFAHKDVRGYEIYTVPAATLLECSDVSPREQGEILARVLRRAPAHKPLGEFPSPKGVQGPVLTNWAMTLSSSERAELSVFFESLTGVSRLKACPRIARILSR